MSESAKIGRSKRSPAAARYKAELKEQKNKRLKAERLKKHPKVACPTRGTARAKRRLAEEVTKIPARVLSQPAP
jgi:hypothetical protein